MPHDLPTAFPCLGGAPRPGVAPRPCVTGPVRFLASVTSASEASAATEGGADLIDAKDPARGALGALPLDVVRSIREAVPRRIPVSATVGDLAPDAEAWTRRARELGSAGADVVKIGMFPGGDARSAIAAAGRSDLGGARLFGVLLADRSPDWGLVAAMSEAGFLGVMVDTADKSSRPLPDLMGSAALAGFLAEARRHGLMAGLAGSLRAAHIPALSALGPDILGFRGALCPGGDRTAALDRDRVGAVREALAAAACRLENTTA